MISLGALTFAVPAALFALLALPALWWLLRVVPPAPMRVRFPPLRLLAQLTAREQSVQRTPLWLLALRIALAALIILGLAHPLLDAEKPLAGAGPVILMVDDGWAAAHDWPARQALMTNIVDRADREGRSLVLVTTAPAPGETEPPPPRLISAVEARERIRTLEPRPWQTRRRAALDQLAASPALAGTPPGAVFWLSDGIEENEPAQTAATMAQSLLPFGGVTLMVPQDPDHGVVLRMPTIQGKSIVISAVRPASGEAARGIRALSDDGAVIFRESLPFAANAKQATMAATLPLELVNRIVRIELEQDATAGSVVLLDEGWRRRPVGIVTDQGATADLPLLSETYYVERALEPVAEVRRGSVSDLLGRELSVLFLADATTLDESSERMVDDWVRKGGVFVRFAGPLLAARANREAPLLPTPLRASDRVLGGAMAWREPARLAPFAPDSVFAGIAVPSDVEVRRQVLVEPSLDRGYSTWARLDDGTPLVTAARRDDGWVVLFHITANADWSSLPLSGLFVQMLERLTDIGRAAVATTGGPPLEPAEILDGFGRLGAPPAEARSIASASFAETSAGSLYPPGFYGVENRRKALNLSASLPDPAAIGPMPADIATTAYDGRRETDLRPWLLGLAFGLALVDFAVSMAMRGLFRLPRLRRVGAAAIMAGAIVAAGHAGAQTVLADGSAAPEALSTSLAYVRTGNPQVDDISRAGLAGLSTVVNRRTAAELADPVAVDIASDELSFYPLIYWPLDAGAALPSVTAADNIRTYMAYGGTLLFDARRRSAGDGSDDHLTNLRGLAQTLDIPPLAPVSPEHVLARAYYLLPDFPGRWRGPVWIEQVSDQDHDGVSSVIAGSNDWAGAWAMDEFQRPMFPVVPGGELQREQAFRFGINLVMYTLTGNYKADQVHLPAILERLGH